MKKRRVEDNKPEKESEPEKKKSLFRIWIVETFIPAGVIALLVITFVAQIYKVPTGSMIPTIKVGDRILVLKFAYGIRIPFSGKWLFWRPPKRGDVVVFLYDKGPWKKEDFIDRATGALFHNESWSNRKNFVKRLIGTPGDRLEIKGGHIFIDGKLIDDPPAIPLDRFYYNVYGKGVFYSEGELTIPKGDYFFLGDNNYNSLDSRYWGFVTRNKIKGEAVLIIWPPSRIGVIH